MRVKLLDSQKLTTIENGGLITRRNVLIGSGLCVVLVAGCPFFSEEEAYAQSPLINAFLAGISLAWEIWKIFQPTEGKITIVNRYEAMREGNVVFQVVGPRGVENYAYFPYRIPPRYQNTYEFDGGPSGTFPGQKNFTGRTARGQQTTPMYVEDSSESVTASRIFAGPTQYPPKEFAAYGILAFRSRPSSFNRDRYLMFCEVYATALPHAFELAVPPAKQMVTVWPLNTDDNSNRINQLVDQVKDICQIAVDNYGLVIAQRALKDAELAGVDTTGTGQFLIAWSPSTDKGKQGVPVLVSDLSDVTTYEQAHKLFLDWSRDIERDHTLWSNGWDIERLRRTIQQWVDKYGSRSLALFGVKG